MIDMNPFSERVLELTRRIPRGKVSTYSEIARALGNPKASRAVGNALRRNACPGTVPCYRVVRSDGSTGGYSGAMNSREKIRRLERDRIITRNGKVDLKKCFYKFAG
jgi:O-6-methylguanine DNA methyltransferase